MTPQRGLSVHLRIRLVQVIGFCPTGWMYEMKKKSYPIKSKRMNSIHLVPYSEHSSYLELRDYVRFLKPHKVGFSYHLRLCITRFSDPQS